MRDVLTRISINDKTLSFTGVGFIDQATATLRNEVLAAKKTDFLVGRGDVPRVPALPSSVASTTMQIAAPIASSPVSAPVAVPAGRQEDERPLPVRPAEVFPATHSAVSQAPITSVSAASEQAPAKRRGRPPKNAEAAPASGDPVAPFRQAAPEPEKANGQFGIAQAPAPNAELESALKSMFR